jgi:acyl-coenzyme A synthetase/AMP-(fatty) acid ligase
MVQIEKLPRTISGKVQRRRLARDWSEKREK